MKDVEDISRDVSQAWRSIGFGDQLQQAFLLKMVDTMKDLYQDVNFNSSDEGLQVQSVDSSHVALLSLLRGWRVLPGG